MIPSTCLPNDLIGTAVIPIPYDSKGREQGNSGENGGYQDDAQKGGEDDVKCSPGRV